MIEGNTYYLCNNSECGILYEDFTELERDDELQCYICPNCNGNEFALFEPRNLRVTSITRHMVGEMS